MIELTRLSNLHRAILAGSDSLELYLAPRRRGFIRVSTTETCRIPKGQHAVSLITGQNLREQTGEVVQFILKRDLERAYSRRRRAPPRAARYRRMSGRLTARSPTWSAGLDLGA
jgi:hypothetical protein